MAYKPDNPLDEISFRENNPRSFCYCKKCRTGTASIEGKCYFCAKED